MIEVKRSIGFDTTFLSLKKSSVGKIRGERLDENPMTTRLLPTRGLEFRRGGTEFLQDYEDDLRFYQGNLGVLRYLA